MAIHVKFIHSMEKKEKKKCKENPFCFMSTEKMYVVKFNFNSYNDNKQPQHTSIEEKNPFNIQFLEGYFLSSLEKEKFFN